MTKPTLKKPVSDAERIAELERERDELREKIRRFERAKGGLLAALEVFSENVGQKPVDTQQTIS